MPRTRQLSDTERILRRRAARKKWREANAEKNKEIQQRWSASHRDNRNSSLGKWRSKNAEKERAYRAARYAADPQKFRDKSVAYYAAHAAERCAYSSKWVKLNPLKAQAGNAKYYRENSARLNLISRQWRANNPGKSKEYYNKRRAIKLSAGVGDLSVIAKWEKSWRSKREVACYWCSNRFSPKKCHTDHMIPLSKGGRHSVENLCISCGDCNLSKHAKTLDKWNSQLREPVLL